MTTSTELGPEPTYVKYMISSGGEPSRMQSSLLQVRTGKLRAGHGQNPQQIGAKDLNSLPHKTFLDQDSWLKHIHLLSMAS